MLLALLLHIRLQPFLLPAANRREFHLLLSLLTISGFELARSYAIKYGPAGGTSAVRLCCFVVLCLPWCYIVRAVPDDFAVMDVTITLLCCAVFLWVITQAAQVAILASKRIWRSLRVVVGIKQPNTVAPDESVAPDSEPSTPHAAAKVAPLN
jgi:hypothetical protein